MYDYIKGTYTYKTDGTKGNFATIETENGVGYRFELMDRDFELLPELGKEVKMYCVLVHREDKMSLCGFLKRADRDIFNILTLVSGVGTKMALTLLNSFEVADLAGFVLDGDYKELTRAKGVGQKLAQKIILELKDKITSYQEVLSIKPDIKGSKTFSKNMEDARMVLLSLGYEKDEVSAAMSKVMEKISPDAAAEDILKNTLKVLSV